MTTGSAFCWHNVSNGLANMGKSACNMMAVLVTKLGEALEIYNQLPKPAPEGVMFHALYHRDWRTCNCPDMAARQPSSAINSVAK